MSTQHEWQTSTFTSPDLHFRSSTVLWGPLRLMLTNYREGAELGYYAGQAAYGQDESSTLENVMQRYFLLPHYHPRICTTKIVAEWQALFLLGWTGQLLEETGQQAKATEDYLSVGKESTEHAYRN